MQIEVRKADMGKEKKRLKVCAYARVSTEASEQENSLENQVSHYTEMIQSNPAYEFAGVYADFGISGFKESRPQFQKMMQDAKNGKIDLIITKSVSRFARNTAIVLKASRELKERNVGIFFELQNINTLTEAGELLLTILAAFAQAESESASESSKMAYLHRIENGEVVAYLERSYGYEKDENGLLRLSLAETRGDGLVGEDVTANALVVPDVKKYLKLPYDALQLRGEVYMSHSAFEKYNDEQERQEKNWRLIHEIWQQVH